MILLILVICFSLPTSLLLPMFDCSFHGNCDSHNVGDSWWRTHSTICLRCTAGKKYHCVRDYDKPDVFKEGCAVEKICLAGEEPHLSFKENGKTVTDPVVYCRTCYDDNTFNRNNIPSSKYIICGKKTNNCSRKYKIPCKPDVATDNRFCRCDARKGYYPDIYLPVEICSYDDYECTNKIKCKATPDGKPQQLLLNYTCAPLCDEGFDRLDDNSDECLPILTSYVTTSTIKTSASSSSSAEETTTSFSFINTTTGRQKPDVDRNSTSNITRKSTKVEIIIIEAMVLTAIGIAAVFYFKSSWCKHRNKRGQPGTLSETEEGKYNFTGAAPIDDHEQAQDPTSPAIPNSDAGPLVHYKVYNVQNMIRATNTDKLTINIPKTVDTEESETDENTSLTSRSRASTSASKHSKPEKRFLVTNLMSGRETKSIPDFLGKEANKYSLPTETHTLDRRQKPCFQKVFGTSETKMNKIPKDVKDLYSLSDEEYKGFVTRVLRLCYGNMVQYLNPVPVLDIFTRRNIFTITVITDIMKENITSNKTRELLKRLREKGTVCYMQFKEALLESKQDACFNELEKQEIYAYQERIGIRKKSLHLPERDHLEGQFVEIDKIAPSRPLSKDHKIISSSIGFDPTGNSCDVEQNKNGNWDLKKEKYPIKDEQFAAEAGDVQQQEMEVQAKEYLQRLNDAAGDFSTFVEEVDLVKEDIDKRFPHLLTCPNETLTKLECPEEENSPEGFQAYKSSGISNSCLYQSVSMLLRGDEQLQHRLRLKTTLHCCKAFSRYMKGLEVHFQHEQIDTIKQFFYYVSAETWERISDMTEKENIIKESLKALITETACIGTDSSRLHVQFLSDALAMKIEEHFQLKHHFGETKTVIPLEQTEDALGKESLHIYWIDMTGKGKKMNHIVPLLRNS